MKKDIIKQAGFTLVELIMVIALVTTLSGVIGVILYSSLRSATKTTTATTVQQNGDYAVAVMTSLIRSAKNLYALNEQPADCSDPTATYSAVTVSDTSDNRTTFFCPSSPSDPTSTLASNSSQLIDSSTVSVTQCYFTCSEPSPGDLPTIGIYFTVAALGTNQENRVSIPYQTQVTLRNNSL